MCKLLIKLQFTGKRIKFTVYVDHSTQVFIVALKIKNETDCLLFH